MICVALFRVNFHSTRLERDLNRIFELILITELFVVDIINHYFSGNDFYFASTVPDLSLGPSFPIYTQICDF